MTSLRTKKALTSAPPASAAHAIGSAPMVIPPTAVAFQARACSATSVGQRAEAGGAEDRALGVDQVLGGPAAGQHDFADHERVVTELGEQPLSRGRLCVESHR